MLIVIIAGLLCLGAGVILGQVTERRRLGFTAEGLPRATATRRHLKDWRRDRLVLAVGNRRRS